MTTKLAKWASEHDQIIKSRLSYGHQAKLLSSVTYLAYEWLRFEGYLGNVGLSMLWWMEVGFHGSPGGCRRNG